MKTIRGNMEDNEAILAWYIQDRVQEAQESLRIKQLQNIKHIHSHQKETILEQLERLDNLFKEMDR